jgi:hypothetical protein
LKKFYTEDNNSYYNIESLIQLGEIGIALPFIIKAYRYNLPPKDICELAKALESILLRQRLIGKRADVWRRINDVYKGFNSESRSIQPIVEAIENLKHTGDWWWKHWNDDALKNSIQDGISYSACKFLLWKYENHLRSKGKGGYPLLHYDEITGPELEHIAPKTKKDETVASGYCEYDEDFLEHYLNCLGNYLLISKSHNCSIGNRPFRQKRETYTCLEQQQEIRKMTNEADPKWDKALIAKRKEKIIDFIMETF